MQALGHDQRMQSSVVVNHAPSPPNKLSWLLQVVCLVSIANNEWMRFLHSTSFFRDSSPLVARLPARVGSCVGE
jgi:hypothetical protein